MRINIKKATKKSRKKVLSGQSNFEAPVKVDDLTKGIVQMNLESAKIVPMTDAEGENESAGLPTDNVDEKENIHPAKGNFQSFLF